MAEPLSIPEELAAEMTPAVRTFVESLLRRIADLEARLNKTPQNSSLPPGSQHPHAKPPREKRKSKKQRGGQPGHRKAERKLIPTGECDKVVTLRPKKCRGCGGALSGDDREPHRHQVWEMPVIKPLVTEYQQHRLACSCCGVSTRASLPKGVPAGQSGPRLVAFVTVLMAYFRQSKRRTAEFVSTVLNIPCSASLTIKHQAIATAAVRGDYDALVAALPTEPMLHGDESPTKEGSSKAWLWTFVAQTFTVFAIRGSRAATVLSDFFGEAYRGVMHCDRAKMYWQLGRLQWCWAHLKRNFQALIDDHDRQVKRLGHDLMRQTKEMFRQWSRCRDGTISFATFQRTMKPIRDKVDGLLLRGACSGNPRLEGMCQELFDNRQWLWTFVDVKGVEPTNNTAERALRPAVIWRKLSFGTQSAGGSRQRLAIETHRDARAVALDRIGAEILAPHRLAVDVQDAPADLDAVPGQADDALDVVRAAVARQLEHRDIAARRQRAEDAPAEQVRAERHRMPRIAVGELRDEQEIAHQQRRDHAARGDVERLERHGADADRDERRVEDGLEALAPAAGTLAWHRAALRPRVRPGRGTRRFRSGRIERAPPALSRKRDRGDHHHRLGVGRFVGHRQRDLRRMGPAERAFAETQISKLQLRLADIHKPSFLLNEQSRVRDAALVVLDEVSMVGPEMAADLLQRKGQPENPLDCLFGKVAVAKTFLFSCVGWLGT